MADTTHTSNYQLKEIGTGREAGTWGVSANENLSRLEAAIGKVVSLDVTDMPISSTSATSGNSWVAEWITVNASDSKTAEDGSEGRCRAVEFTGTVTGNVTVKIRGASTAAIPARVLFVKNSLSNSYTLTLDADGTDYTLVNGASALVAVIPAATGGYTQGVHSLLGNLNGVEIAAGKKLNFVGAGEIDFDGAGTITIPTANAAALKITDGSRDWIILNSVVYSGVGTVDINAPIVDFSTQNMSIYLKDASTTSLTFTDGTTQFLQFDTSNNEVNLLAPLDIDTATINSATQATTWTVIDNSSAALNVVEGATSYLKAVTTNAAEKLTTDVTLQAPDMIVTGTDGYVNFNSTAGSGGIGIRNNSGLMEVKNTGGSWAGIAKGALQAITAATSTTGEDKQGAVDLGPIRLIWNTFQMNSSPVTVTLGTGNGTSYVMSSALYSVMACQASGSNNVNVVAHVTDSSAGEFEMVSDGSGIRVTFWAIGDSAA